MNKYQLRGEVDDVSLKLYLDVWKYSVEMVQAGPYSWCGHVMLGGFGVGGTGPMSLWDCVQECIRVIEWHSGCELCNNLRHEYGLAAPHNAMDDVYETTGTPQPAEKTRTHRFILWAGVYRPGYPPGSWQLDREVGETEYESYEERVDKGDLIPVSDHPLKQSHNEVFTPGHGDRAIVIEWTDKQF